MASQYQEKLLDPRWQRRRLEVLERAGFTCERCEAADKTLHVHHRYYHRGVDPWNYPDGALECLCKDCHALVERQREKLLRLVCDPLSTVTIEELIGYVKGRILMCGPGEWSEQVLHPNEIDGVLAAAYQDDRPLAEYEKDVSRAIVADGLVVANSLHALAWGRRRGLELLRAKYLKKAQSEAVG